MKYLCVVFFLISMTSCTSLYPIGGAVIGGAGGSFLGPAGAAVGSGAGAAAGQILAKESDLKEAKETIKALSEGDVQKMIELQAGQQKGTFDKVVDGIYRLLYLGGICMILWFVIPWIWARKHVKKTVEKHLNGNK